MTTLNDIIEKKSFYMDKMIYPQNEDDEYLLMKYGPYMFKNHAQSMESLNRVKNPKVNHLVNALTVKSFESDSSSIMDMKKKMNIFRKSLTMHQKALESVGRTDVYSEYMINSIGTQIDKFREYQKDKRLLESAMVSYSPIVPYQGFIVSPGATSEWSKPILEEFHKEVDDKTDNMVNSQLKTSLIKNKIQCKEVLDNLYIHNIFSILDSADIVKENIMDVILADMVSPSNMIKMFDRYPALEYYALVEYYFNNDVWSFDSVITAFENMSNFLDCDTSVLVDSISNANLVVESQLIDQPNQNAYYASNRIFKYLEKVDTDDSGADSYNIEKLLSVFRINTAYKCDDFCNNAFLKATGTTKYSFLNDEDNVLVAIIDDQYLAIPFIDQSDDWKMKLLTIDGEGTISITRFLPDDYDTTQV